jgi:hypothetical protein
VTDDVENERRLYEMMRRRPRRARNDGAPAGKANDDDERAMNEGTMNDGASSDVPRRAEERTTIRDDVVVRGYERLRSCVEMRMPITIVSPMVPITMVLTKVQTPD